MAADKTAGARWARALVAGMGAASLSVAAQAAGLGPLLPGGAFSSAPPCAVDPFADAGAEQRAEMLRADCGQDRFVLNLRTPRANPTDTGASRVELEVDQLMTRRFDSVLVSARLGYAAAGAASLEGLHTARMLLAAGGQWRIDDDLALDVQLGRDAGPAQRSRARLGGQWRPAESQLLFAQWASDAERQTQTVGWRMSMWRERAWLEFSARRDGDLLEPRVGLRVTGFQY